MNENIENLAPIQDENGISSIGHKDSISKKDIQEIRRFSEVKIKESLNPAFIIHDWEFTEGLIEKVSWMKKKENLDRQTAIEVEALIYFYNIGYVANPEKPLEASINVAKEYLGSKGFTTNVVNNFGSSIASIDSFDENRSRAVKITQDILNSHYGEKKLKKFILNLHEERNIAKENSVDEVKWVSNTIDEMIDHRFNTLTAKKKWNSRKAKNLERLRRYLYQLKKDASLSYNKRAMTMFKTASRNQIDLVNIADKKAGIMITVNAVLITIMLPLFASYIIDLSQFFLPSIILILTCGISIILATLATKPVSREEPTEKEFTSGDKSLFYFRNFIKLDKESYKTAIHELIVRDTPFENAVVTDLYDLGVTLGVKYRKLTWCYWVFAIGIGLTIVSFIFCMIYFSRY